MSDEYENLRERYVRLRGAAQRGVNGTRAAAGTDRPLCAVEPYLIRPTSPRAGGRTPAPAAGLDERASDQLSRLTRSTPPTRLNGGSRTRNEEPIGAKS